MLNNAQVTYVNENGGNDLPDNWFEDITGWIGDLLANPLWSFLDWFTQAEWVSEVGELANDSCTPGTGILGELERRVGQTFPDLRAKQQAVVDAWRTFQRAWPWDKASTAEAYETQVKVFLAAVKAQIEQLEELPVGGVTDWLKTNWKILAISGSILAVGITGAIVATRGLSREK